MAKDIQPKSKLIPLKTVSTLVHQHTQTNYVSFYSTEPDGPPLDLEVITIDSMILQVNWAPPEVPNGIIEYYKMYVNFTNSTKIRKLKVDPEYTIFYLEFLNPYQVVGISISAVTVGGEGPATSFVFNRTRQAGLIIMISHFLHYEIYFMAIFFLLTCRARKST